MTDAVQTGSGTKTTTLESRVVRQAFDVAYRYPVHFTRGAFEPSNPILADTIRPTADDGPVAKALFVLDQGLLDHHGDLPAQIDAYVASRDRRMRLVGPHVVLPGGEAAKNDLHHLQQIYDAMYRHGVCRHSYVVVVGGGAVVDVAGYAAGTAHRGIRLVRIPTTVLAQNDAGIGVKNSVNAFGRKNFLGTFAPPVAVINDSDFLATLAMRDWRAGVSEAIKVALIKDAAFFDWIEQNAPVLVSRDMDAMERLVFRCAELHLNHIATAGDPFETGSSRPLDFGHWSAHKLEQMTGYRLRHGEAVAIGMALDMMYSVLTGLLPRECGQRIIALLRKLGFGLYVREMDADADDAAESPLLHGLDEFREHLGGRLSIPLLRDIGSSVEAHEMDRRMVRAAIRHLAELR